MTIARRTTPILVQTHDNETQQVLVPLLYECGIWGVTLSVAATLYTQDSSAGMAGSIFVVSHLPTGYRVADVNEWEDAARCVDELALAAGDHQAGARFNGDRVVWDSRGSYRVEEIRAIVSGHIPQKQA